MKATDFEYRHQTLVHQFIVAAALLTYFVDREDIVWRFVKDSSAPRGFERVCFIVATVFIVAGAAICTSARVYRRPERATGMESYRHLHRLRYFGDLLYMILALLLIAFLLVATVMKSGPHASVLQNPPANR